MMHTPPSPVVHLEPHTGDLARARASPARVCGGRTEQIELEHGAYHSLDWGGRFAGGIVEYGTNRRSWLPYVEVAHIAEVTERARRFGASVLLEPREGPAGWRSVVRRARGP
jgi:predicted enzyme related to lactoylglutathione lyase